MQFNLKKATPNDFNFLISLRLKTMKPFFEKTIGWNDETEKEKAIDNIDFTQIVTIDKKSIGVIKVIDKKDELHLDQLQILPQHQKNGFGEKLLQQTIKQSQSTHKPITLFVIKNTPAKKLYERYGFKVTEEFEHYCKMRLEI